MSHKASCAGKSDQKIDLPANESDISRGSIGLVCAKPGGARDESEQASSRY
jgi:hypothetical protein